MQIGSPAWSGRVDLPRRHDARESQQGRCIAAAKPFDVDFERTLGSIAWWCRLPVPSRMSHTAVASHTFTRNVDADTHAAGIHRPDAPIEGPRPLCGVPRSCPPVCRGASFLHPPRSDSLPAGNAPAGELSPRNLDVLSQGEALRCNGSWLSGIVGATRRVGRHAGAVALPAVTHAPRVDRSIDNHQEIDTDRGVREG